MEQLGLCTEMGYSSYGICDDTWTFASGLLQALPRQLFGCKVQYTRGQNTFLKDPSALEIGQWWTFPQKGTWHDRRILVGQVKSGVNSLSLSIAIKMCQFIGLEFRRSFRKQTPVTVCWLGCRDCQVRALVYGGHSSSFLSPVILIILYYAQAVNPEVANFQPPNKNDSVLICKRKRVQWNPSSMRFQICR